MVYIWARMRRKSKWAFAYLPYSANKMNDPAIMSTLVFVVFRSFAEFGEKYLGLYLQEYCHKHFGAHEMHALYHLSMMQRRVNKDSVHDLPVLNTFFVSSDVMSCKCKSVQDYETKHFTGNWKQYNASPIWARLQLLMHFKFTVKTPRSEHDIVVSHLYLKCGRKLWFCPFSFFPPTSTTLSSPLFLWGCWWFESTLLLHDRGTLYI